MNSSQIKYVNGRQPQIAGSTIMQQPNSTATSNMVLLRHPMTHATTNPNTVSVQGSTPVRSLVVSQPSTRPQTTTITGTTGGNVQMYVAAPQPVSILPRGGAVPPPSSPGHNMGRGWTPPPAATTTNTTQHHGVVRHQHYPSGNPAGPPPHMQQLQQQQQRFAHHHPHPHMAIHPHQHQQHTIQHQQPGTFPPSSHGLRVSTAPTISQAPASAITVQAAAADCGHPRILPASSVIRPKVEAAPSPVASRGGIQASEDPAIKAQVQKCSNFLNCLIRFSDSDEKRRKLVCIMQELIDAKITVHQYMERVADCLKSSSQLPQLRPFLEMVLPHLRREMYVGNLKFADEQLRPPPLSALQATRPAGPQTASIQRPPAPVQPAMPPMVHASPTIAPASAVRQPMGTVAIHAGAQRAPTPTAARTMAVGGALRALHPRPAPILTTVAQPQPPTTLFQPGHQLQAKPVSVLPPGAQIKRAAPRTAASTGEEYEEYNDVAMMGGVNLTEESRNILPTVAAPAAAASRTCKEQLLLPSAALRQRVLKAARGMAGVTDEALSLISHALEERLKNVFTQLSVAVEHRTTQYRECPLFEQETDVRGQLKFLEEIDRAEKVRHDDEERAALIKAARSRSRNENMDHLKMKEKARLMMQKEYEMEKQREANITALAAIGTRKKRKLDTDFNQLSNDASLRAPGNSGYGPGPAGKPEGVPAKRVVRRATMKDLMHVMEHDPKLRRSQLIWKATLK